MLKIHLPCNRFFRYCAVFSFLFLLCVISVRLAFGQDPNWNVGKTIGLRAGTCIREGPGFTYRAHTRVPEDNWTVKIIDGPRTADGLIWWDTSRNAAGDPSGGTGWVTQAQTDTNCDYTAPPVQPSTPPAISPTATSFVPPAFPTINQDLFEQVKRWWYQQAAMTKWVVAVVALLAFSTLWRFAGSVIIEFIGAIFLALVIWVLLNLTRAVWQDGWNSLAAPLFGGDVPDLALLVSALPLASWLFSVILRSLRLKV